MSTSLGNAYNALNLFYSGTFALRDGDEPAVWELSGFGNTAASSYELLDRGLEVVLGSRAPVVMTQNFSRVTAPFDFTLPLAGGLLPQVAPGYQTRVGRPLPVEVDMTLSFDVTVESGRPGFRVLYRTEQAGSSDAPSQYYGSDEYERASEGSTTRINLPFRVDSASVAEVLADVGLEMQSDTASTFVIDRLMLAAGNYSSLPYTGDPFTQVFPAGCIVMTIGQACPTGFKELGDGDKPAPASWDTGEPGIRARLGNYPRSGTDFAGDPLHASDSSKVQPGSEDTAEYESYDGRLYQEYANTDDNPTGPHVFTINTQNPDVDKSETHEHDIGPAKTRPLSIGLLFCERQ